MSLKYKRLHIFIKQKEGMKEQKDLLNEYLKNYIYKIIITKQIDEIQGPNTSFRITKNFYINSNVTGVISSYLKYT